MLRNTIIQTLIWGAIGWAVFGEVLVGCTKLTVNATTDTIQYLVTDDTPKEIKSSVQN